MSDKDYEPDWLAYWESFCAYLTTKRSRLNCEPKPKRAFDLKPRGDESHITVRYSITRNRVVTELTFEPPKERSNANYERVSKKYESSHPELDWNKAAGDSESHTRGMTSWSPRSNRKWDEEHKAMMVHAEMFLDWIREFGI